MTWLIAVLEASLSLFLEVLPFFALGVLLAGAMKSYEDRLSFLTRLGHSRRSILLGAVVGGVLPVCSCGVVPVAMGLLAGGVAPGPVFAFLAAAPMVNPASFVMTAGVMGYPLACGRLIGAIALGIAIGSLARCVPPSAIVSSGGVAPAACCRIENAPPPASSRLIRSFYLGGQLGVSLLRYVIPGTLLGGCLAVWLDPGMVARYVSGPLAVPLAALAGVPLYLCSCAEVPVAVSFARSGLEPAAVLTFLLAGPGVSLFTLVLLWSLLRLRMLIAYAAAFVAGSMAIGFLWKALMP